MSKKIFTRWLTPSLYNALKSTPSVFVNGPRQAGKSTLVKQLTKAPFNAHYVTLDDMSIRHAAESDPQAFLRQFKDPVIIDEVQLVPTLFRAIKLLVDEFREESREKANGQFILTGSANIMSIPLLSDALVGRTQILSLLPLSMGEFNNNKPALLQLFETPQDLTSNAKYQDFRLEEWIHHATFPEVALIQENERESWYQNYISTLIQRDIRELAEIDKISSIPNLLRILALRAGSLINDASVARDVGLNAVTYSRYRNLLQGVFLVTTVKPWIRNIAKQLVKSSKLFFYDTGLLAHLLDITPKNLMTPDTPFYGHLIENFVATELMKQLTLSPKLSLFHFRSQDGKEVDFVIEGPQGKLIGLEVKSSSAVNANDFAALQYLKYAAGPDFKHGIVLYTGQNVLAFGPDLFAVPITALMGEKIDE